MQDGKIVVSLQIENNNIMVTPNSLNPAQIEVLNMMSFINTKSSWQHLKDALSDYFAKQLDDEIDSLWQNGTLNEEKVEGFLTLHERTPYRQ